MRYLHPSPSVYRARQEVLQRMAQAGAVEVHPLQPKTIDPLRDATIERTVPFPEYGVILVQRKSP